STKRALNSMARRELETFWYPLQSAVMPKRRQGRSQWPAGAEVIGPKVSPSGRKASWITVDGQPHRPWYRLPRSYPSWPAVRPSSGVPSATLAKLRTLRLECPEWVKGGHSLVAREAAAEAIIDPLLQIRSKGGPA